MRLVMLLANRSINAILSEEGCRKESGINSNSLISSPAHSTQNGTVIYIYIYPIFIWIKTTFRCKKKKNELRGCVIYYQRAGSVLCYQFITLYNYFDVYLILANAVYCLHVTTVDSINNTCILYPGWRLRLQTL